MEFNYRSGDERAHSSDQPPVTHYNYLSEQPIRGGYSTGGVRRDSDYFKSSVREAIYREIDKERMNKEGFVEENQGRRAVEEELRRDLRMEKELALRGRGVNEMVRFQAGIGMRVEDRRMTVSEERSLEERIAKIVEERIVSSLEERIVRALEWSGMVERIARTVEERLARTLDERIAISLEGRIARKVEERIAISLERFGTEARRGEQPLVPFRPVKEVDQPLGHIMKEAKSDANRCNTNTPPKQHGAVRKAASTDVVAKNTVKEDRSCANRSDTNAPPKQGIARMAASTDVANNRVKEVWSCSLCKVITTSKRTLDDHVRGKKHKLNEASLNVGSKRKNSDNVLSPNKKQH